VRIAFFRERMEYIIKYIFKMYLFRVIDIVITLFIKLVKFKVFDLSVILEIDLFKYGGNKR
jgi:hypothetical protein